MSGRVEFLSPGKIHPEDHYLVSHSMPFNDNTVQSLHNTPHYNKLGYNTVIRLPTIFTMEFYKRIMENDNEWPFTYNYFVKLSLYNTIHFSTVHSYGSQTWCNKEIAIEPVHEISNNVVCVTSKPSDQPAHMCSLIRAFASRLNILLLSVKLLTEHDFEFLNLKGGCKG